MTRNGGRPLDRPLTFPASTPLEGSRLVGRPSF